MNTTTYHDPALAGTAVARDQARELLGGLLLGLAVAPVTADYAAYADRLDRGKHLP